MLRPPPPGEAPAAKVLAKIAKDQTPLPLTGNFSKAPAHEKIDLGNPYDKPIAVAPPATLREALLTPWAPQYKIAMQIEYDGHLENKTWEIVPRSSMPPGANLIRGKWVFDDKRGEDGKVKKFKARFVAMGFTQREGIDYTETFAGVVVAKSFRIMLSMLNEDPDFEMEHWDVKMAFTQAGLDEELYMAQPEGFEIGDKKDYVCLLKKSLYGLKQSARNWSLLLKKFFSVCGFIELKADACLFILKKGKNFCLCSTHVDDIFALFNKGGKLFRDKLFNGILAEVKIENLGPVSWALKTLILRDRKNGILKISQEQFTKEFLQKEASAPRLFPPLKSPATNPNFPENFSPDDSLDREDQKLKQKFQCDVGSFWWLAQISRPDIFYAVHRCAKLINKPCARLGQRIQKIKDYLALTPTLGIVFQRHESSPTLSGYVDAAFAAEDSCASRVGYFFLFRGNLVSWASENPTRIMTSSTEVECRGLVHFGKENLWHRQLHLELGLFPVNSPTEVYEDNTASITLASSLGTPHKKSKHFGLEWAWFKESVEFKEIVPIHVGTDQQPADMLTKAIISGKFSEFRDMVMGVQDLQTHFEKMSLVTLLRV